MLTKDNISYIYHAPLTEESTMKYDSLSFERMKEILNYDPATGVFTWKRRPAHNSRRRVGDVAGSLKASGYRYINIDNRSYLASQLAWAFVHGEWPRGRVGVKDKNPENLRGDNLFAFRAPPGEHENRTLEGRAQYRRAHHEAYPHVRRGYGFMRYYGITSEDYQRMFAAQGGVCAICKKAEHAKTPKGETKWLSVDHCHNSSVVRELLCSTCNHMLGHAFDDPAVLRAAADYIEKHQKAGVIRQVTG